MSTLFNTIEQDLINSQYVINTFCTTFDVIFDFLFLFNTFTNALCMN